MQPLFFQVHNPHSRLGCDLYEDSDDSDSDNGELPSTIEEEDLQDGNESQIHEKDDNDHSDNCSCCSTSETETESSEDDDKDIFNEASDSEAMFDGSYMGIPPHENGAANSVTTMPAYRYD